MCVQEGWRTNKNEKEKSHLLWRHDSRIATLERRTRTYEMNTHHTHKKRKTKKPHKPSKDTRTHQCVKNKMRFAATTNKKNEPLKETCFSIWSFLPLSRLSVRTKKRGGGGLLRNRNRIEGNIRVWQKKKQLFSQDFVHHSTLFFVSLCSIIIFAFSYKCVFLL